MANLGGRLDRLDGLIPPAGTTITLRSLPEGERTFSRDELNAWARATPMDDVSTERGLIAYRYRLLMWRPPRLDGTGANDGCDMGEVGAGTRYRVAEEMAVEADTAIYEKGLWWARIRFGVGEIEI